MGRLTWPILLVFCSKSRTLEPEPEINVAETLTGTSEAVEPDISRTTAWRDMGKKKAILRTVGPRVRPSAPALQRRTCSMKWAPGTRCCLVLLRSKEKADDTKRQDVSSASSISPPVRQRGGREVEERTQERETGVRRWPKHPSLPTCV